MKDTMHVSDAAAAAVLSRPSLSDALGLRGHFHVECRDRLGNVKWIEDRHNLVTTLGGNDALTQYLKGSAYTAAMSLSLIDDSGFTGIATADSLTSHAGWTELTSYSASTRLTPSFGTASGKSIDNSASPAKFTMTGAATVNGLFMVRGGSTKGSTGTTGTLVSEVSFAAKRVVASADILSVTYTVSG